MSSVEIPEMNYAKVEKSYRLVMEWRAANQDATLWTVMREARLRNPKLLKAMEQATEIMVAENEKQYGEYQRQATTEFSQKAIPIPVQMFREAYKALDRGTPEPALCWMYAAGAWLAGLI